MFSLQICPFHSLLHLWQWHLSASRYWDLEAAGTQNLGIILKSSPMPYPVHQQNAAGTLKISYCFSPFHLPPLWSPSLSPPAWAAANCFLIGLLLPLLVDSPNSSQRTSFLNRSQFMKLLHSKSSSSLLSQSKRQNLLRSLWGAVCPAFLLSLWVHSSYLPSYHTSASVGFFFPASFFFFNLVSLSPDIYVAHSLFLCHRCISESPL